ncbi:hypothetical protein HNP55_001631 [Paucibacter oligotrophus]|uniref:DUF3015 family protein n=1 Tax=Roseateles oligotrophus TaxID=1769250 RepID=A0A840L8W8_9BURK|nr:DUF3015 family protein [Roseateles oligotrophus]MBB4843112.1 hypothetical protein [Roseateles oligotrophus]
MNKKAILVAALAVTGFAGSVQAREFADIYTECGLGAMIAPNNAVVAAITNVTWDLGTTAISSNVSSADTCKGGQKKVASLLLNSYAQLETDLAKGEGQHLAALSDAAGCTAQAGTQFQVALRQDFAALVAKSGYAESGRMDKAAALYTVVEAQARAASCTI